MKKLPTMVVPLTMELAKRFYGMGRSFCERPFSGERVARLLAEFKDEPTLDFNWAVAILDGVEYRVNGQHTSTIFATGKYPILPGLSVVLATYICSSRIEITNLWGHLDSRDSSRTRGEVVAAYAQTDAQLAKVPKSIVGLVASGISMAQHTAQLNSTPKLTSEEIGDLVLSNGEFILFCWSLSRNIEGQRKIRRAPVYAAMYSTYLVDPEACQLFWTAVRDGTGYPRRDPDRVLHNYLGETKVVSSSKKAYMSESREIFYSKCIHAWNAWRTNRELTVLKHGGRVPRAI